MRRVPQQHLNLYIRRERDRRAFGRQVLLLLCGVVLAGGFVVAVGQHFAAVQYGYKSEEMRRERAHLLEEQQRLLLELDKASAPAALERAAREIGMQPTRATQLGMMKVSTGNGLRPATAAAAMVGAASTALHH